MSDSASYSGRRYGSTFSLSVPGRKPRFSCFDGGTGQYDAPDLPVLESTYRFGYGKIGFAGACRSDGEGDGVRFDGVDVGYLSGGFGTDRFAEREGDDARHVRTPPVCGFLTMGRVRLLPAGHAQFLHHAAVAGMCGADRIFKHVLVEHATDGIGVHRRGIGGLDDIGNHLFGLGGLGFGFAGMRHDGDAVAPYDDGQVGERTFDFPKHLVHRAEHGHRIKLLGYRDGACSGGHRTSSDVGIGSMWTIRRAFRR